MIVKSNNIAGKLIKTFSILLSIMMTAGLLLIMLSCNSNNNSISKNENKERVISKAVVLKKPASTSSDTLKVNMPAAVFYHPDSLQLIKIKASTDSMIYEGSMHEFFYQMRNAKSVIKKTWPWLSVIELKNHRFITFVKSNGKADCIDLNNKNDVYGLFVFNGRKSPLFVDMTNIETVVSFYLNDASK